MAIRASLPETSGGNALFFQPSVEASARLAALGHYQGDSGQVDDVVLQRQVTSVLQGHDKQQRRIDDGRNCS